MRKKQHWKSLLLNKLMSHTSVTGRGFTAPFLILALLTAGLAKWLIPPVSQTPVSPPASELVEYTPGRYVANDDHMPQMHASTARQLVDGRLQAAWFTGTSEGKPDVVIRMAEFDGRWQNHRTVLTRTQLQQLLGQSVRKLGNPVLLTLDEQNAMLFVVSVGLGGWATAQINVFTSADNGQSWQFASQPTVSAFLNMSSLVRNRPVLLTNNQIGLPAYHELATTYPQWMVFNQRGKLLDQQRLTTSNDLLQPVVHLAEDGSFQMWARPGHLGTVQYSQGKLNSIEPATDSDIINGSSGLDVIRLQDDRLLMAVNDAAKRNRLSLYLSQDGESWQLWQVVRESDDQHDRYGYPWLEQTTDGSVHLFYTENRRAIVHHILEAPL